MKNKISLLCRIFSFLLALMAAVSLLAGCAQKVGSYTVNGRTVVTVNGFDVSFDEYKYFYYNHMMDLKNEGVTDFSVSENVQKIKDRVENSLKTKYTVMSLIDEYKIALEPGDEEDINESVSGYIYEQGGEDKFRAWLSESRMTGDVFRDMMEYTFFYDVYLRELLMTGYENIIKMDDASIKQDVLDNFYRYTQIYIAFEEGDDYVKNGEEMNKIYEKLENGESFYQLALDYSEWNIDAEKGVYSTTGEKLWNIEKAALALENGQYSEVIRSTEGHHIVMRLPLEESYIDKNIDELELPSFTRRYHEYIKSVADKSEVKYNKYYDTVTHEMLTEYPTV